MTPTWKDGMLPLHQFREAGQVGLEPTVYRLEGGGIIRYATDPFGPHNYNPWGKVCQVRSLYLSNSSGVISSTEMISKS